MVYRTVAGCGTARLEDRGSTFVGHVATAESVEAAEVFVDAIQAEHPDATHAVPAYRVRADPLKEWESDDGEPAGSAGSPALTVLAREGLENVVAVVIRYYGGTELGVGGLARAYAGSVGAAVDDAGTTERRPRDRFQVTVGYDDSGSVRSVLESADVTFEAAYEAEVTFEIRVPSEEAPSLCDRIRSATGGRAAIESA